MGKSPVEFIVEKLTPFNWTKEQMQEHYKDAIEKAKEMEKEQIKDTYFNGRYEADKIVMGHNFYAEQYYKQTFKSE